MKNKRAIVLIVLVAFIASASYAIGGTKIISMGQKLWRNVAGTITSIGNVAVNGDLSVTGNASIGDASSTGTSLTANSDTTGTPIKAKVEGTDMFQCNQYGCGVGAVAPSNTDDFFHIERNVDTSTGILVYNKNNTASADSFIHLFTDTAGPHLRINPVPTIRGGYVNLTAQQNTAFNILQASNAPIVFYTNNTNQGSISGAGNFTLGSVAGENTDRVMAVKNLSNGASAVAKMQAVSDTTYFTANVYGSGGGSYVNFLASGATGGVNFFQTANSFMDFYTNNTKRIRYPADAGMQFITAAKPTCDAAHRGTLFYVAGDTDVADTFEACTKDASNVYAWRALY